MTDRLRARAREEAARSADPARADGGLEAFLAAAGPRADALLAADGAPRALARLLALGEFPAGILARDPEALGPALAGPVRPPAAEVEARLRAALASAPGPAGEDALRRARHREILRVLAADVAAGAPLPAVAGALSDLADGTLRAVIDREAAAAAARDGAPRHADGSPAALACLALGKLGGAELNYSSDVDLLFLASGEGACAGGRGLAEHWADVASAAARLLSRRAPEGALYRVDLRLRPRGTAGVLVPRADAALRYYRTLGRGWERQALLKARAVAGSLETGAAFLAEVEPWVYGRPLLSAEIAEIRRLKRTMEESPDAAAGNLKTGRGGIRDVEYVVQFLQLLLGAALPSIRGGNTLEALRALVAAEALAPGEAAALEAAYVFLRTAEHRLQAAGDAPVRHLPADEEGLRRLARSLDLGGDGADPAAAFREAHARHAAAARGALDRLVHGAFAAEEERARRVVDLLLGGEAPEPAAVTEALLPFGFRAPAAAHADLRRMAAARSPWLPRTRTYFASAAPLLLTRCAATPDPDRALSLLQRLSERAAGTGLFFSLLTENPDVLGVFCDLGGGSPVLAEMLEARPALMDALLDALTTAAEGGAAREGFALEGLDASADPAAGLRDLRDLGTLRAATRDLQGRAHARRTARDLSDLADEVVGAATAAALARTAARHGGPAPGRFAVLALGRLGARETAYGSDLDLLLLQDGEGEAPDGTGSREFFERAGRELLAILAGGGNPVYRVDVRLRPEGGKGTLVPALAAFLRYQRERGRTWERQALVRARPVGGDAALGAAAMEGIAGLLWGEAPPPGILAEVASMRAAVEAAAPAGCLKSGRGGMQDAEFAAQGLVLAHGHRFPEVRRSNTVDALSSLREAGVLAAEDQENLVTALLFLRSVELRLRLVSGEAGSVLPADAGPLARRLGYVDTSFAPAGRSLAEEVGFYRERMRAAFLRATA